MKEIDVSAVILAKNEERMLARSLKSVNFCREVIVLDDFSTDRTAWIARKYRARVMKHALAGNFARQRNFALSRAKSSWVLFVDADEVVTPALRHEITKVVGEESGVKGYALKRQDFFLGRKLFWGEVGNISLLRLGQRNAGKWQRAVHETWKIHGQKASLASPLFHYPHQTLGEFAEHLNFQSTLHARANFKEGKRASILKVILLPMAKFVEGYFLKLGILDGWPGLVLATLMSFHSFLAWAKLWQIQKRK